MPVRAQWISLGHLVQLGSDADERARNAHLQSGEGTAAYLIRSASSLSRAGLQSKVSVFAPEFHMVTNSGLPFSMNDGPLWAGRGANAIVTAGVGVHVGRIRVTLAPQLVASENRAFQVIPYPQNDPAHRSVWANPFHPPPSSIDLPIRFGDRSIRRLDAGQSAVTVDLPAVSVGVATENLWWGPGVRNAIVLSNNAPGFPHAFVETRNGLRSSLGTFGAQWLVGRLRESDYFDADTSNNARSLSGVIIVWTPPWDSGLSLGASRTVFASARNARSAFANAFDVFRDAGHPNTDTSASAAGRGRDQLFSLFGRWVFPAVHFAAYAEWARFETPLSLRDFLEFPGHSQGYTAGLEWARPWRGGTMRLQAEGTYLEPDPSLHVRPVGESYTSRSVVQGYTHRGESLGAAIGPGASSQWLAVDFFRPAFRIGVFGARIRWDNAVLWDPIVPQVKAEDVTIMGGLRAGVVFRGMQLAIAYTDAVRLDYLFQDKIEDPAHGTHDGVDIVNRTLSVTLSAAILR